MSQYIYKLILAWLMLIPLGSLTAGTGEMCKTNADSNAVVILLCKENSVEKDWIAAGESSCAGRTLCNAWVWTDEKYTPLFAPKTDAGLPKSKTRHARAIWVNDSESLIRLRKVEN